MDENQGWTNEDVTTLVMAGNEAALQWYSAITGKPLPQRQPTSVLGVLTGSDFGGGGAPQLTQGSAMTGLVLVGLLVVGVYVLVK